MLIFGLLIPFLGTVIGAASVFLMRKEMGGRPQKALAGFASGVMVAAAVWSLIDPALEAVRADSGLFAFLPVVLGIAAGFAFLLLLDEVIPHLHVHASAPEGRVSLGVKRSTMVCLAITLHNIPEGMAEGVVLAGSFSEATAIDGAKVLALTLGMALQNIPEGAIVSMPLAAEGGNKARSFFLGALSGVVEPLFAALTIFLSGSLGSLLPVLLSAAAGAMLYVVVEELIPQTAEPPHSNVGTIGFALGLILMMILDNVL